MFEIRTDLAIEEKTENRAEQSVAGVSCREWREPSSMVKMTEVKILDEHGARALRKPVGTYLTLEAKTMGKKDEDYHREVSEELAAQLVRMIREIQRKEKKARSAGKVESMEWWRTERTERTERTGAEPERNPSVGGRTWKCTGDTGCAWTGGIESFKNYGL